ncbi:alkaline phosphatase family protein [Haladaptatus pallidirubidus]|uniref:Alkaline phosphatase family protein n=1 Tax=Haladaptatus pallidirubidus TaxID=1008152 RepID=A0AAV3UDQ4_9EURY|nr:alkaline phosphatase family protein [Haladaptatus pallidirubidus]
MDCQLQTLLVGIDAGCRSVLDPLFEDDALPHLQSIFAEGTSGPLESQIPPWTPSAWPSLYSGVNPGKHGVFGFLDFDGYDWDVVNASRVREHTLWELLDHNDRSSVVVNAPVTHPPRAIDGAVLPGYTAPENPRCHPEGLLDDVRNEIGGYRVYPPRNLPKDKSVEWYRRLARMRGEAFRYLVNRFDPEFGFVQFQSTDSVFHEHPGEEDIVRAVYESVDEQVGEILDDCDPDTIIVASDHGIGEYTGYEFRVNDFLREEGYVKTARGGEGMPSWSTIASNQLQQGEESSPRKQGTVERGLALAAKVGITSQRIGTVLSRAGLDEFVAKRVPEDFIRAATEQVDFSNSAAFMRDRIECGIRINLEGREPDGVVPPEKYDEVRDELIETLDGVRTPDGQPVFETIAPREAFFDGPYSDEAVDVVCVPAAFDQFLSAQLRGQQFGPPREPWNHKLNGIFAAAGANIDADAKLADAHLFDVAPTILATLGVPASDRMDGRVLPVVESVGEQSYPAYDAGETVETDDERVEARLADLGYLE